MNEYTFETVPGLVGRFAELLESIDSKLDKVNVAPIPTEGFLPQKAADKILTP